jgi:hypothetical protein
MVGEFDNGNNTIKEIGDHATDPMQNHVEFRKNESHLPVWTYHVSYYFPGCCIIVNVLSDFLCFSCYNVETLKHTIK